MKVQIKTAFGEMSFDMATDNVLALINQAISYANGDTNKVEENRPRTAPVAHEIKAEEPAKIENKSFQAPEDEPRPQGRSRAETMFGSREGWNMPAAGKANAGRHDDQEAYKGFLYIRCENCGEVKGYNAKFPSTYHRCSCGHNTDLRDLRVAHVRCQKCGASFNYRTNLQHDFTIECITCGSPVDMELGAKGTAFVTVGQKPVGGGVQGHGKPFVFRKPGGYL